MTRCKLCNSKVRPPLASNGLSFLLCKEHDALVRKNDFDTVLSLAIIDSDYTRADSLLANDGDLIGSSYYEQQQHVQQLRKLKARLQTKTGLPNAMAHVKTALKYAENFGD